jgi:hypothetical protein
MRLEKVKTLISDGKTQQAIDLLQDILKDKNIELLNQTLLLEGQFKDLQKKMQLGLLDATAELNRINFTVLSVCDDASNLENIAEDAVEKPFSNTNKPTEQIANKTLLIFGVIAVVATALILGIIFIASKSATPERPKVTEEIAVLPLPQTTPVAPSVKDPDLTWFATPASATISEKYNGNVKTDVLSIKVTPSDADSKILTVDMKLNCLSSSSGKCLLNYLEFRLVAHDGDKYEPKDAVSFANSPKDGTSLTNKVSFVVPKSLNQADLQMNYKGKLATTLATLHLNSR